MQSAISPISTSANKEYYSFILVFVVLKVGLNLLSLSHFGFQRDELLYVTMADHLAWGYNDVPPIIAFLAKLTAIVFGNSLFASRIFPTICSAVIVWLTGLITVEFGGKKFAITLACLAVIFSPAFAASGYLFEPVVFDQLWWILAVWMLIKYCNTSSIKYLYFLGVVIGLGMLTKYTMGFFTGALIIGLIISKQRKILLNRHVLLTALIALLLFLPNMLWQFTHHLPVINHMQTLQQQQLHSTKAGDFILQQLVFNGMAVFLWLPGLYMILFSPGLRKFKFLAFAFLVIFAFYLVMNGKNYYILGAYPMLFAAGGICFEKWLKPSAYTLRGMSVALLTLPNLIIFPIALPLLSLNQTVAVFNAEQSRAPALNFIVMWDDNKIHGITQNYGDMLGWEELTDNVAKTWRTLTPEQQTHTQIYTDNYGEAGAINHYGKKYHLLEAISLYCSFSLWAPNALDGEYIIYVDEQGGKNVEKLQLNPGSYCKTGVVENPLSVEKGTSVFLLIHPPPTLNARYKEQLSAKRQYGLL
jgi:hypothetical protein